jgi:hypothetical protein
MNQGNLPAGERPIVATVLSGQTDREKLIFVPGARVGPISLGTRGAWKINAQGVAPEHVFLHFDGRDLFACSAARAMLAGLPLNRNWVRVSLPCELRFEGACLIIRQEAPSRSPEGAESTMGDGGALAQAAQRAVEAAMYQRPAVPGGPVPWAGSKPPGPPAEQSPATHRMAQGLEAMGGTVVMHAGQVRPGKMPLGRASAGALPGQTPAAAQRRADVPAKDAEGAANEPTRAGFWRSASPVKKVTVLLMPLAIVGSYFAFFPTEPPKPPAGGRGSTAATASARTAGIASSSGAQANAGGSDRSRTSPPILSAAASAPAAPPSASAAPTVASARPATPPPKTAGRSSSGGRSPEREALDSAAAGSFDEAAKRYDALAAAHPDNTVYKEAARILHAKAAPNGQ